MELILIGLSHKTAPVDVRECLAFSEEEAAAALAGFKREPMVSEAVLFSTCNRVEALLAGDDPESLAKAATDVICRVKNISPGFFTDYLYQYRGDAAFRHVFRVASSLDSMVVGEPQILGQVKKSFRAAVAAQSSGVVLNRLLHRAFSTAKRIRKETGIGGHAVSVSFAAVELAKKIFGDLAGKKVLLIGAGEMAELAVEHLMNNRAEKLVVANRTLERAAALAERFKGSAIGFSEISDALKTVDIVISSTGAPGYVLKKEDVKQVMRPRKNRPLFFIDIAVPRDIDPAINKIDNAYVYDVDDLAAVVEKNMAERMKEAARAEVIVEEAVTTYRRWFDSLEVVPTIKALCDRMEAIRASETQKSLSGLKDLDDGEREAVDRLTRAIMAKVLHGPIVFLKSEGHRQAKKRDYIGAARDMFRLDEEDKDENGQ